MKTERFWKNELLPIFKNIPHALQSEHENFVRAYKEGLSLGHKSICTKFGGNETGSLITSHGKTGLKNLENFEANRLKMLDPNNLLKSKHKCPFH